MVGDVICESNKISKVSFTGSTNVGKVACFNVHMLDQYSTFAVLLVINGKMCRYHQTVVAGAWWECSINCVQFC